jgi:hypothetical protein
MNLTIICNKSIKLNLTAIHTVLQALSKWLETNKYKVSARKIISFILF